MDWRFENDFDSFTLNIGPFIVAKNILLADITEAVYMVKNSRTDADEDALATLDLNQGITKVVGTTESDAKFSVKFDITDFGTAALQANKTYCVGLGIKTVALTKFLELELTDNTLKIEQDFIRG